MRQHLSDYIEHGRGLNLSPYTLRAIGYNVTDFLDWLAGHRIAGPDQLRRAHLAAWLTHLQEHRTTRGLPLKPKSINKKIENVRGFLLYLAAEGLIPSALAASVEYVKEPKLLPTSVMTHDQVRKLLRSFGPTRPPAIGTGPCSNCSTRPGSGRGNCSGSTCPMWT